MCASNIEAVSFVLLNNQSQYHNASGQETQSDEFAPANVVALQRPILSNFHRPYRLCRSREGKENHPPVFFNSFIDSNIFAVRTLVGVAV